MLSHWFVYYVVRYINKNRDFCEIRGNSVHKLPSRSFLPGTVRKVIIDSHLKQISAKILGGHEMDVVVESFGAIDQEGFDDFNNNGLYVTDFNLSGREFIHRKTTVVVA